MEFRILGPLEVRRDGRALDLPAQQRVVLAVLLAEPNRIVSSERLIDALWDDDPPHTARKALQVHVSLLRKLLGRERIETAPPGYRLRVDDGELDLARFLELQGESRFDEALELWRGAPLADLAEHPFAAAERARLEELRLACQEERIERELTSGRHAELIPELEALTAAHPLRERLRGQLMLALYRAGRQADALDAYRDVRGLLVEELGIEPARALRELHQSILEQTPELEPAPPSRPEQQRAAFVGRGAELARLVAGLEEARAGHGRLFLVSGEPGIGKSRLAEELTAEARSRGMRVLVGRCWEAGGAPAYWPWVQSLRPLLGERELFGGLPTDDAGARFRLFDTIADVLRTSSGARPIVLVLDDLHAADDSSLLMLRYVARELTAMHVLILALHRDIDPVPNEPLADALAELAREPVTGRVALAGLSEEDLARYVELAAPDVATPDLIRRVHGDTEGNPLFVGEIVRLHEVEPGEGGRLAIPRSVHGVIARRLRHLPAECNRVLQLASVVGREFRVDLLARAAALEEEELLDLLDGAMSARVVSDVPGAAERLRFAHVLIRDALYEGLTPARRALLHRLVVSTLEERYGSDSGAHHAQLAHHAIAGGDFERGTRYATRAAERALALLAFEESARLCRAALDALAIADPADERARCEILLLLGDAEARSGASNAAGDAFAEAAAIADRLGLHRELARAAFAYGGRFDWSRAAQDPRRLPLLERALERVPEHELELRARLLGRLAGALRDEHSSARRDAVSAEAVDLARRSGDAGALAYALSGRAAAIIAPDTVDERLALGAEVSAVAAEAGDLERVVAGYTHRLLALFQLGDLGAARAALNAADEVARRLGQPAQLWEVRGGVALLELALGNLDLAEQLSEQALELGEAPVPDAAIPVRLMQCVALRDLRGGLEQSAPDLEQLVAGYPSRLVFRCGRAYVNARFARREAAAELTPLVANRCAAIPFDQEWLLAVSFLAEACTLTRRDDLAEPLYELLLPWAPYAVSDVGEGFRGAVARDLGMLAAALGRLDDAARHFEEALEMNAEMRAMPWIARTQDAYARMLLARDALGDRERAAELAAAARATGFTAS